jgi:hypothetical protein
VTAAQHRCPFCKKARAVIRKGAVLACAACSFEWAIFPAPVHHPGVSPQPAVTVISGPVAPGAGVPVTPGSERPDDFQPSGTGPASAVVFSAGPLPSTPAPVYPLRRPVRAPVMPPRRGWTSHGPVVQAA